MAARRKSSLRRLSYRVAVAVGLVALVGGMFRSVERGSQARALSRSLTGIEHQTIEARARLTDAMRRVDSLASRDRILNAAARLGLHPPSDADISFLRLTTPADSGRLATTRAPGSGDDR